MDAVCKFGITIRNPGMSTLCQKRFKKEEIMQEPFVSAEKQGGINPDGKSGNHF